MKITTNNNIIKHKPALHGGLYSIKSPKKGIIDFSSNVNPLGCPSTVKRFLKKQIQTLPIYPDPNSLKLKQNIEKYTNVPENQIVVGNGATEIIYNYCYAFLNKKTSVLIPIPTFSEYEVAAKLCGCKISFFKTMNLNDDLNNFLKKIPNKGCIFICNPNNPIGILISRANLQKIISLARKKSTLVFVDECFIELSDHNQSVIRDIKKFDNLFVLRSLTKSFGLAGLRVGYGLGNKKPVSILNKIKIPWNVNSLGQKAATIALQHDDFLEKTRKIIFQEKRFLKKSISKIDGLLCYNTNTNFILIKSKTKSNILKKKLLKKNILIRDCNSFRGLNDHFFRIAVKTRKENSKLIKALEEISNY